MAGYINYLQEINYKYYFRGLFLLLDGDTTEFATEIQNKRLRHFYQWAAWISSIVIAATVLIGVGSYIASTVPSSTVPPQYCEERICYNDPSLCPGERICDPAHEPIFEELDAFVVAIFTAEFIIRVATLWAVPKGETNLKSLKWLFRQFGKKYDEKDQKIWTTSQKYFYFFFSFRTITDLAIIVPYYVSLAYRNNLNQLTALRVFRVFRVFRIFSIFNRYRRFSDMSTILILTIKTSFLVLLELTLFFTMLTLFLASIFYVLESGTFQVTADYPQGAYFNYLYGNGQVPSSFRSIPVCIYFICLSLTTVGYGDMTPATYIGRYIAVLTMFLGIIFIVIPVAVTTVNFKRLYMNFRSELEVDEYNKYFLLLNGLYETEENKKKVEHMFYDRGSDSNHSLALEDPHQLYNDEMVQESNMIQECVNALRSRSNYLHDDIDISRVASATSNNNNNADNHTNISAKTIKGQKMLYSINKILTRAVMQRQLPIKRESRISKIARKCRLSIVLEQSKSNGIMIRSPSSRGGASLERMESLEMSARDYEDDDYSLEDSVDYGLDDSIHEDPSTNNDNDELNHEHKSNKQSSAPGSPKQRSSELGSPTHSKYSKKRYNREGSDKNILSRQNSSSSYIQSNKIPSGIHINANNSASFSSALTRKDSWYKQSDVLSPTPIYPNTLTTRKESWKTKTPGNISPTNHLPFQGATTHPPTGATASGTNTSAESAGGRPPLAPLTDIHTHTYHPSPNMHSSIAHTNTYRPSIINRFSPIRESTTTTDEYGRKSSSTNSAVTTCDMKKVNREQILKMFDSPSMESIREKLVTLNESERDYVLREYRQKLLKHEMFYNINQRVIDMKYRLLLMLKDYEILVKKQEHYDYLLALEAEQELLSPAVLSNRSLQDQDDEFCFNYSELRIWLMKIYECLDADIDFDVLAHYRDHMWLIIGSFLMYSTIILGILSYILATIPKFRYTPTDCYHPVCKNHPTLCPGVTICEPVPLEFFHTIDYVCLYTYLFDYVVRTLICWAVTAEYHYVSDYGIDFIDNIFKYAAYLIPSKMKFTANPQYNAVEFYLRYLFSFRSLIDVICISPLFFNYKRLGKNLVFIKAFLVVKLGLTNRKLHKMLFDTLEAFHLSRDALVMLIITAIVVGILFGSFIYYTERGVYTEDSIHPGGYFQVPTVNGLSTQVSLFSSVVTGIYFTFVTLTSEGYGDIVATTAGGRALAMLIMILGVYLLSLPIGVVQDNFSEYYNRNKLLAKIKPKTIRRKRTGPNINLPTIPNLLPSFSLNQPPKNDNSTTNDLNPPTSPNNRFNFPFTRNISKQISKRFIEANPMTGSDKYSSSSNRGGGESNKRNSMISNHDSNSASGNDENSQIYTTHANTATKLNMDNNSYISSKNTENTNNNSNNYKSGTNITSSSSSQQIFPPKILIVNTLMEHNNEDNDEDDEELMMSDMKTSSIKNTNITTYTDRFQSSNLNTSINEDHNSRNRVVESDNTQSIDRENIKLRQTMVLEGPDIENGGDLSSSPNFSNVSPITDNDQPPHRVILNSTSSTEDIHTSGPHYSL